MRVEGFLLFSLCLLSGCGEDKIEGIIGQGQSNARGAGGLPLIQKSSIAVSPNYALMPSGHGMNVALGLQPGKTYDPLILDSFSGFQALRSMQLSRGNGTTFLEGMGMARSIHQAKNRENIQTLYWSSARGGVTLAERGPGTIPYQNTLAAVKRSVEISNEQGKKYEISAVAVVEGEADAGNKKYLSQIKSIYGKSLISDVMSITGQDKRPVVLMSQPSSFFHRFYGAQAIYQAAKEGFVSLVSPGYFLDYEKDNLHYTSASHLRLGEYFAKALNVSNESGAWRPLMPESVSYDGELTIRIKYHVPKPPIVYDGSRSSKPDWGYEVYSGSKLKPISSVNIVDPYTVQIKLKEKLAGNRSVRYAMNGFDSRPRTSGKGPSGSLRDSDDTPSVLDGTPLYNWGVHFYERF